MALALWLCTTVVPPRRLRANSAAVHCRGAAATTVRRRGASLAGVHHRGAAATIACPCGANSTAVHHPQGGAGTGPFTPTPPPLPGFGWEVPDHGCPSRPKKILLDLVEGEKMGFHPMCLYSKYSVFFSENPIVDENQIGPNMNTAPV